MWYFADLVNVFEVFFPKLLLYPNPFDPLNADAVSLMICYILIFLIFQKIVDQFSQQEF